MYYLLVFLRGRLRCFADLELSVFLQQGVLQRRRCDEPPERASSYLQGSHNCLCERVRATIHTLHDPFYLLECIYGLAEIGERRVGVLGERPRINAPHLDCEMITLAENASRYGDRVLQQCLGFCEATCGRGASGLSGRSYRNTSLRTVHNAARCGPVGRRRRRKL